MGMKEHTLQCGRRSEDTVGKTLPLAGPKAWTSDEVIALCEQLSGMEAEVRNVPVGILKGTRALLRSMQWASDAADRLVSVVVQPARCMQFCAADGVARLAVVACGLPACIAVQHLACSIMGSPLL